MIVRSAVQTATRAVSTSSRAEAAAAAGGANRGGVAGPSHDWGDGVAQEGMANPAISFGVRAMQARLERDCAFYAPPAFGPGAASGPRAPFLPSPVASR